jgi:hypothetical protein
MKKTNLDLKAKRYLTSATAPRRSVLPFLLFAEHRSEHRSNIVQVLRHLPFLAVQR